MSSLELFPTDWRTIWNGSHEVSGVGSVYTKPEIVDLILDISGYRSKSKRLSQSRVLEPSCGDGAFLHTVVERLVESERIHCTSINWADSLLDAAIRAVDIDENAIQSARAEIVRRLGVHGCSKERAIQLSESWTTHDDFLLMDDEDVYDFVLGNPPYVRLEALPKAVLATYRLRYATLTDRADIYVAFLERGLRALSEVGTLGFIVANRFTKNQYGASLRRLVGKSYRVRQYINLEHTQPFLSDVSAYPSIVILDRALGQPTMAGELQELSMATLDAVRTQAFDVTTKTGPLNSFPTWYQDGSPWRTTCSDDHAILKWLEDNFPVLEDSGGITRAGIGVATGADSVYVLPHKSEVIEDSRQIPLIMAKNIKAAGCEWSGHYLVNPFADADDGSLVNLTSYPGLAKHFENNREALRGRHVAKARPQNWFRTIDRIWPKWQRVPKLVVPDIQSGGVVGYDEGEYYPHHNVYWITSDTWDLRALQAVLRSSMVLMQVRAHSVQMRGGSLRYQTQTLRKLRVPEFKSLDAIQLDALRSVCSDSDPRKIDDLVEGIFRLRA